MSAENRPMLAKPPVLLLCALLCCGLWGSAIPAIKYSYAHFGIDTQTAAAPLLFAGVRFALAGILVLLLGSALEKRPLLPGKGDWGMICSTGAFQTVGQYLLYYIALTRTSGTTASILVGSSTFFSILLAALVFRMEKLTPGKLAGCLVGFGGMTLVQLNGSFQFTFSPGGEGLMLLSALCSALAAVLIGRYSRRMSPIALSGWQFLLGGLVLAGIGLALGGRLTGLSPAFGGMMVYLAAVSAVAYTLWGCLLKYNPVSRVTIFGFLTPVFGVLLSALLLRERGGASPPITLAALSLVCLGILLVNRQKKETPI